MSTSMNSLPPFDRDDIYTLASRLDDCMDFMEEAADLIVRMVKGEVRPRMAMRQLPLFWGTPVQVTAHPPMDEVMRRVHEMEKRPGILSVTVATSFPWADVPDVGARLSTSIGNVLADVLAPSLSVIVTETTKVPLG